MDYYIVDAFTHHPFGGNPAGVVLFQEGQPFPPDGTMQHIAAELRYSETAFVLPISNGHFRTRYFTPLHEVPLCGHATIAAFGVLLEQGHVAEGQQCVNSTPAGDLDVLAGANVMMRMAPPQVVATLSPDDDNSLRRIAGCPGSPSLLPSAIASTGLADIMMQVENLDQLQSLSPNMDALSQLCDQLHTVSLHAFAITHDGHTAHVRDFAPLYGVPEESATGTANAALTFYLHKCGIVPDPSHCSFLQGEAMGRPSVVLTTLNQGTVHVGGESYVLAHGELRV